MNPSIRSIAAKAGVSPITVSRALREGDSRVAEDTRQRVLKIAKEQGYRPSPEVSRLMTGVRQAGKVEYQSTLAVFSLSENAHWQGLPYTQELSKGITRRAEALGFGLEVFSPRLQGMNPWRMARILRARNIVGILVLPSPQRVVHLQFPWQDFCALSTTYALWRPKLHRVFPHHYHDMQETIFRLRRLGYQRIGLAMNSGVAKRNNHTAISYFCTYQSLFAEVENRVPIFLSPMTRRKEELSAFRKWFEKYRPDVIITAAGWHSEFIQKDMGLRVPEDVAIAYQSVLDAPSGAAGIDQSPAKIGAVAVGLLAGMINRNERGIPQNPIVHSVEGSWVQGNTVRNSRH